MPVSHTVVKAPRPWRWFAPYGPADYCQSDPAFQPPFPSLVLACGRTALPAALHLRKISGCYTVALQNPKGRRNDFDLVWAPAHDRISGPHVISTLTSPHDLDLADLKKDAQLFASDFAEIPRPLIAVLIGGTSRAYRYSKRDAERLTESLRACVQQGCGLVVTLSRRTPRFLLDALSEQLHAEISNGLVVIWTDAKRNPYQALLSMGDGIIVTADSINMTGEACLSGVPVAVFHPTGGSKRFRRFHSDMEAAGYTRRLTHGQSCDESREEIQSRVRTGLDPADFATDIRDRAGKRKGKRLNSTDDIAAKILEGYRDQHSS